MDMKDNVVRVGCWANRNSYRIKLERKVDKIPNEI